MPPNPPTRDADDRVDGTDHESRREPVTSPPPGRLATVTRALLLVFLLLGSVAAPVAGATAPTDDGDTTRAVDDIAADGALTDMIQTSDGGYLLVGWVEADDGSEAGRIVKVDGEGRRVWERTYDAEFGLNFARFLAVTPGSDGGYVVAGVRSSPWTDGVNGWALKVGDTGRIDWEKTPSAGDSDGFRSVAPAADGGYLFAGYSKENGRTRGWAMAVGASGARDWTQTYRSGSADSSLYAAAPTDDGHVVAGRTGDDGLVLRLDGDGDVAARHTYLDDRRTTLYDAVTTADGGLLLAGEVNDTDDGRNGVALKLDGEGSVDWTRVVGGAADDWFLTALQTSDGGYLLAGPSQSVARTGADGWAVKLDADGSNDWSAVYGGDWWDTFWAASPSHDDGYMLAGEVSSFGPAVEGTVVRVGGHATKQIRDERPGESGVAVTIEGSPVRTVVLPNGVAERGVISVGEKTTNVSGDLHGEPLYAVDVVGPYALSDANVSVDLGVERSAIPGDFRNGSRLAVATHDTDGWSFANASVVNVTDSAVTLRADLQGFSRIAVAALEPPTATVEDDVVLVGERYRLSATTSAAGDASVEAVEWYVDDEAVDGESVSFDEPGEHTVSAVVRDEYGLTTRQNATVLVNDEPSIAVDAPTEVARDETATFEATVTDQVGDVTVTWTLGDETVEGASVEHAFADAGEHTVTVEVTDEHGATATEEVTVEVSAGPDTTESTDGATTEANRTDGGSDEETATSGVPGFTVLGALVALAAAFLVGRR